MKSTSPNRLSNSGSLRMFRFAGLHEQGLQQILQVLSSAATGTLTRDIFSFVAGTSTGAIIATAIAAGIPAARILDLYINQTREIFARYPWTIIKRVLFGYM